MKKLPQNMNHKGRFYTFVLTEAICRSACFLWLKSKVQGLENIPAGGCYMVCCNHPSFLDFMLLIFLFRKNFPTFFIHKEQYWSVFHFFLKDLEQIPAVNGSISKAEEVLKEGLPLFIFPEGKRSRGKVGEFRSGVAVLAEKFPFVSVVPVGIKGAEKVWPRGNVLPDFLAGRGIEVSIGKSLRFCQFSGKKEFLAVLKEKITELSSYKGHNV